MAKAKVRIKPDGIAEILKSGEMESFVMGIATRVAAAATASAPVRSGAYKASISAESVQHPTRVVGRVVARDPGAVGIEARTGNLARALDSA